MLWYRRPHGSNQDFARPSLPILLAGTAEKYHLMGAIVCGMYSPSYLWSRRCRPCLLLAVRRPFAILSVDIWSPGDVVSADGYCYLFNVMCDISQFVVCLGCKSKEASYAARLLMEGVLLKFGMC